MSVRKVIVTPDKILITKTAKVNGIDEEIRNIAQDLLDTVKVAKDPEGRVLQLHKSVRQKECVLLDVSTRTL